MELEGTPATKKVKWTLDRKIELLGFMRAHIADGMTEHQAAKEYREYHGTTYNEWLLPDGIISRFHEFEVWSKSEKMTGREMIDFIKRLVRQRDDLTRLTERLRRARPTESRATDRVVAR